MQRAQLRTATQTRRSARSGFPEPDDFEGLPVRQWRQEWVNVAPSLQQDMSQQGDRWAVELPYGMPRESHLLPPHTQELLRAARSGRLYKRPAPAEEEEPDAEVDAVKGEKKDWEPPNDGYMVKTWKQVPRNAETPTISHLAKRHKNTVTLASKSAVPQPSGPTVIRATVRRIDAAGNPYEQTVTLSQGQQVDGEIISTTVVPAPAAAPGELLAQQTTPVRRRPPPPKRKAKGAGRGRKKGKLPLPIPSTRSQASTAEGGLPTKPEAVDSDGIKIEDTEDSVNQDSEMADVSGMPSEDEEGDGGEGEEDEEGEDEAEDEQIGETPNVDDVNRDALKQEAEDSEMAEVVQPSSVEEPDGPRPAAEEEEVVGTIPKLRSQPPTLANLGAPHHGSSKIEGSPLKNVMIQSPTEPSPLISPRAASNSFSASSYLDVQSRTVSIDQGLGNPIPQAYAAETTKHGILPPLRDTGSSSRIPSHDRAALAATAPPPAETNPHAHAPSQPAEVSTTPLDQQQTPSDPQPAAPPASSDFIKPDPEKSTPAAAQPVEAQPAPEPSSSALEPPDSPALLPTVAAEDEDDGLNLLGSLERELDRQASASASSGESDGKNTPVAAAGVVTEAATAAVTEVVKETTTEAAVEGAEAGTGALIEGGGQALLGDGEVAEVVEAEEPAGVSS